MSTELPPKRNRPVGTAVVNVQHTHAGSPTVDTKSDVQKIPAPNVGHIANPAYVTVEGGITRNTGDYNSIKVGVIYSMPCEPTLAAMDALYEQLSYHVDSKLQLELDLALGVAPAESGASATIPNPLDL